MKLLCYEFRKLLLKPVFLLLAFFVAAVLLVRFYGICQDLNWLDQDLYQEKRAEMELLPHDEALAKLSRDSDGLLLLSMREIFGDTEEGRALLELHFSDIAAQYGMTVSEFISEYENTEETGEELNKLQTVLSTLSQQYSYIDTYRAFIEEFPLRAEKLQSVSIFAKQKSFSNRSILKSLADYTKLGMVEIHPDYDHGITAIGLDYTYIVFVFVIALGAAAILFSEERDSGMIHMLRSTRRGHVSLALAKWGALALFSAAMVLLVCGGKILIARSVLGFGDFSRSLQSVSAFRNCCFRMSVGGYLFMSVLLPMLVVVLFSVLISFLYALLSQAWMAAGITAALAGGQYLFYRFLSDQAVFNVLKFLNLFAFSDVSSRYANHSYINLFGFPVSVFPGGTLAFFLLITLGLAGLGFCFSKGFQLKLSLPLRFRRSVRIRGSVRLFTQEHFRLYIRAFGIVILLILIYLGYQKAEKEELLLSNTEYLYYSWGQEIAGEVTDKTGEWFLKKEEELNEAASLDVSDDSASSEDRMAELLMAQARNRELQEKREVLTRMQLEYQKLQLPLSKGIPVHYISEVQTSPFFTKGNTYLLSALLMMVILCVCFCPIFALDEESGMGKLVHTTGRGRTYIFLIRYLVMLLFYTLAFGIFILPYVYNWIHIYRMNDWDAPLESVMRYVNCEGRLTIRQFLILWFTGSYVSGFGFVALMGLLSKYCKKQSTTVIVVIIVIATDFLVNLLGFPGISAVVLSSGFGMTERLPDLGHTGWLYGILGKNGMMTATGTV